MKSVPIHPTCPYTPRLTVDIFPLTYWEEYVYLLFTAKEGVKYKIPYQILTNFYRQNSSKSIFAKRESRGYPYTIQYTRLSQGTYLGKRRVPVGPQKLPSWQDKEVKKIMEN